MKILGFNTALPTPWQCGAIAAVVTKGLQRLSSLLWAPPRCPAPLIPLMTRIGQLPGGSMILNFGPAALAGVVAMVAARLLSQSVKPSPIYTSSGIGEKIFYQSIYKEIREAINEEFITTDRPKVYKGPGGNETYRYFICRNYPKTDFYKNKFKDFYNAFDYGEENQVQMIALSSGCDETSGDTARKSVDEFFEYKISSQNGVEAEKIVMNAAQSAQQKMETDDEQNPGMYRGKATFLGSMIYRAKDGKKYISVINCGDCKLYHLKKDDDQFVELTKPCQEGSSGCFGSGRLPEDKTEYTFSVEVQSGDRFLFMTPAVHNNLDRIPGENNAKGMFYNLDKKKLSILNRLSKNKNLANDIVYYAVLGTKKLVEALQAGRKQEYLSPEEYPGTLGDMTILDVTVE